MKFKKVSLSFFRDSSGISTLPFESTINFMTTVQMRSRVTKKGQVTVPSRLRRKFHISAGKTVEFESSQRGILLKPVQDIVDSVGALANFARVELVEKDLLESRKKPFY